MSKIRTPWDDHYMLPAFLGCVQYAIDTPEIMAEFRQQTGVTWEPAKTAIDRAIDAACGADAKFMQTFSDWVAAEMFGTPADLEPGA